MPKLGLPGPQGLYDPAFEHDACGVAFVVDLHGRASHERIQQGITALCNLQHRGASGCEVNTGDGAGLLIQIPDRFLREVVEFELPPVGAYATGIAFLPADPGEADKVVAAVDEIVRSEGLRVLGWRDVPTDSVDARADGALGRAELPPAVHRGRRPLGGALEGLPLERYAFVLRKRIEHEVRTDGGRQTARRPRTSRASRVAPSSTRGCSPRRSSRSSTRTSATSGGERARARALALLDEHVPELAARAPVPVRRAQRRDQHAEGQPQLDARA